MDYEFERGLSHGIMRVSKPLTWSCHVHSYVNTFPIYGLTKTAA